MRVCVVSAIPELLVDALAAVGYEVKDCLSTDLAVLVADGCEAVLFVEDVTEMAGVTRRDALKALAARHRVILLAAKTSELVPYAAALGVRDFVFLPASPAQVLHRLANPATGEEAADSMYGVTLVADTSVGKGTIGRPEEVPIQKQGERPGELWKGVVARIGRLVPRLPRAVPVVLTADGLAEAEHTSPDDILSFPGCLAVFVPASWGKDAVRNLRRDPRSRAVPIVVVGGGREFVQAGADRCVGRITDAVVDEVAALADRLRSLWERAETDPLTGLYTRGFWDAWLQEQVRLGRRFSVALIDLDYFKKINDTLGHQAGDAVLRAFGQFLKSRIRESDVAARYGGEEFVLSLSQARSEEAAAVVDRLRMAWADVAVPVPGGEIKCTFSAGVAGYAPGRDVVADADRMLYRAKQTRNAVEADASIPLPTGPVKPPETVEKPGSYLPVALTSPVLVLCSPWTREAGVTTLMVEAGKVLAGRVAVALIDADFENPSLAARLGLSPEEVWPYDWRREPVALRLGKRLYVFPLDPLGNLPPAPVGEVISAAGEFADLILMDAGADPELNAPGTRILVVNERVGPDAARAWEFYRPFSEGALVAVGSGSLAASFGLPVLGTFRDTPEAARALAAAWKPCQVSKKGVLSR